MPNYVEILSPGKEEYAVHITYGEEPWLFVKGVGTTMFTTPSDKVIVIRSISPSTTYTSTMLPACPYGQKVTISLPLDRCYTYP